MYASDGGNANSLDAARDALVEVLRRSPAGLITDIDGTISPIVADRREAHVLPLALQALESLCRSLDLVAVVTGRSVADARRLVGLPGLTYVGNHGFEVWTEDGPRLAPGAESWVGRLAQALAELRATIKTPGLMIENKGITGSIHFRLAEEPDQAELEIKAAIAASPTARQFRLEEGRRVLNLLPPLAVSKGTATRALAEEHGLGNLAYLGDDTTDLHGFEALAELHRTGQCRTLAVGVVGAGSPPEIVEMADVTLPSAYEAARALWAAARVLRAERAGNGRDENGWAAGARSRGTMVRDA